MGDGRAIETATNIRNILTDNDTENDSDAIQEVQSYIQEFGLEGDEAQELTRQLVSTGLLPELYVVSQDMGLLGGSGEDGVYTIADLEFSLNQTRSDLNVGDGTEAEQFLLSLFHQSLTADGVVSTVHSILNDGNVNNEADALDVISQFLALNPDEAATSDLMLALARSGDLPTLLFYQFADDSNPNRFAGVDSRFTIENLTDYRNGEALSLASQFLTDYFIQNFARLETLGAEGRSDGHASSGDLDAMLRIDTSIQQLAEGQTLVLDEQRRVTGIIHADGSRTSFTYDSEGSLCAFAGPDGTVYRRHDGKWCDESGVEVDLSVHAPADDGTYVTRDNNGTWRHMPDGTVARLDEGGRVVALGELDESGSFSGQVEYLYDATTGSLLEIVSNGETWRPEPGDIVAIDHIGRAFVRRRDESGEFQVIVVAPDLSIANFNSSDQEAPRVYAFMHGSAEVVVFADADGVPFHVIDGDGRVISRDFSGNWQMHEADGVTPVNEDYEFEVEVNLDGTIIISEYDEDLLHESTEYRPDGTRVFRVGEEYMNISTIERIEYANGTTRTFEYDYTEDNDSNWAATIESTTLFDENGEEVDTWSVDEPPFIDHWIGSDRDDWNYGYGFLELDEQGNFAIREYENSDPPGHDLILFANGACVLADSDTGVIARIDYPNGQYAEFSPQRENSEDAWHLPDGTEVTYNEASQSWETSDGATYASSISTGPNGILIVVRTASITSTEQGAVDVLYYLPDGTIRTVPSRIIMTNHQLDDRAEVINELLKEGEDELVYLLLQGMNTAELIGLDQAYLNRYDRRLVVDFPEYDSLPLELYRPGDDTGHYAAAVERALNLSNPALRERAIMTIYFTLSSDQVQQLEEDYALLTGVSLRHHLLDRYDSPITDPAAREFLWELMVGTDQNFDGLYMDNALAIDLAIQALENENLDRFGMVMGSASPEVRSYFADGGAGRRVFLNAFGDDNDTANDYVEWGWISMATVVRGHDGRFNTDEGGIEDSLHYAPEEQHELYRMGRQFSDRPDSELTDEQRRAVSYYRELSGLLDDLSDTDHERWIWEDQMLYGGTIISEVLHEQSNWDPTGILGHRVLGTHHDFEDIISVIEDMNAQSLSFLAGEGDSSFNEYFYEALDTILDGDELHDVEDLVEEMLAERAESSNSDGSSELVETTRPVLEVLEELEGDIRPDLALEAIANMTPEEQERYRNNTDGFRDAVQEAFEGTIRNYVDDGFTNFESNAVIDQVAARVGQIMLNRIELGLDPSGGPFYELIRQYIAGEPSNYEFFELLLEIADWPSDEDIENARNSMTPEEFAQYEQQYELTESERNFLQEINDDDSEVHRELADVMTRMAWQAYGMDLYRTRYGLPYAEEFFDYMLDGDLTPLQVTEARLMFSPSADEVLSNLMSMSNDQLRQLLDENPNIIDTLWVLSDEEKAVFQHILESWYSDLDATADTTTENGIPREIPEVDLARLYVLWNQPGNLRSLLLNLEYDPARTPFDQRMELLADYSALGYGDLLNQVLEQVPEQSWPEFQYLLSSREIVDGRQVLFNLMFDFFKADSGFATLFASGAVDGADLAMSTMISSLAQLEGGELTREELTQLEQNLRGAIEHLREAKALAAGRFVMAVETIAALGLMLVPGMQGISAAILVEAFVLGAITRVALMEAMMGDDYGNDSEQLLRDLFLGGLQMVLNYVISPGQFVGGLPIIDDLTLGVMDDVALLASREAMEDVGMSVVEESVEAVIIRSLTTGLPVTADQVSDLAARLRVNPVELALRINQGMTDEIGVIMRMATPFAGAIPSGMLTGGTIGGIEAALTIPDGADPFNHILRGIGYGAPMGAVGAVLFTSAGMPVGYIYRSVTGQFRFRPEDNVTVFRNGELVTPDRNGNIVPQAGDEIRYGGNPADSLSYAPTFTGADASHDGSLSYSSTASPETVAMARDALSTLPSEQALLLEQSGVRVQVVDNINEYRPDLANRPIPGQPDRTFAQATAFYDPDTRTIVLMRGASASNLSEEIWHAIDHSLGNFSGSSAFRNAYSLDTLSVPEDVLQYFSLQNALTGDKEAFALAASILQKLSQNADINLLSPLERDFITWFPATLEITAQRLGQAHLIPIAETAFPNLYSSTSALIGDVDQFPMVASNFDDGNSNIVHEFMFNGDKIALGNDTVASLGVEDGPHGYIGMDGDGRIYVSEDILNPTTDGIWVRRKGSQEFFRVPVGDRSGEQVFIYPEDEIRVGDIYLDDVTQEGLFNIGAMFENGFDPNAVSTSGSRYQTRTDSDGRVWEVVDLENNVLRDPNNGILRYTDRRGVVYEYPDGRTLDIVDPSTSWRRIFDGHITQVTNWRGIFGVEYTNDSLSAIDMPDGTSYRWNGDTWEVRYPEGHLNDTGDFTPFFGDVSISADGTIRVSGIPDFATEQVWRPDGSLETLHGDLPGGGRRSTLEVPSDPVQRDLWISMESTRLAALAEIGITDPQKLERFFILLARFEARIADPIEAARTYHYLSQLLDPSVNGPLSFADRVWLAEQTIYQLADPATIDQGAHPTCNVTTVEKRVAYRNPAEYMRLITEVSLTGRYTTYQGWTVDAEPLGALIPEGGIPRPASAFGDTDLNTDGGRSWASKMFQLVAIDSHWVRSYWNPNQDLLGNFVEMLGQSQLRMGNYRYIVRDGRDGFVGPDDSFIPQVPRLPPTRYHDIYYQITGESGESFVLTRSVRANELPREDGRIYGNAIQVDSALRFGNELLFLEDAGGLPAIVTVDTSMEPFLSDSSFGTAGGSRNADGSPSLHVVIVTAIDMSNARPILNEDGILIGWDPTTVRVDVLNSWGRAKDHTGQNSLTLQELFDAMDPIPTADQ